MARSICKTVPYEGEPQLTLKFPVPIFHQTNQTAPKKTLEFLRLSQKKETKRHFVNSNWSTTTPNIMRYTSHPTNQKTKKKKNEFLESASPKALRSPGKTLHLEVAKFFWVGGKAITNLRVSKLPLRVSKRKFVEDGKTVIQIIGDQKSKRSGVLIRVAIRPAFSYWQMLLMAHDVYFLSAQDEKSNLYRSWIALFKCVQNAGFRIMSMQRLVSYESP